MIKINSLSIALIIALLGLFLVFLGQAELVAYEMDISSIIRSIGTFLLSASFLGFLYEVHTKHQFFLEAHKLALGTDRLAKSGLCDFEVNSKSLDFRDEVKNSREIWTVFSYSSRFLDDYSEELGHALNNGAKVKMMFLDKKSKALQLMRELGWSDDSINSSYTKIQAFNSEFNTKALNVVFMEGMPKYSAVILDKKLYYIFNTLSLERQSVPCLTAQKGHSFFKFVKGDVEKSFAKFSDG